MSMFVDLLVATLEGRTEADRLSEELEIANKRRFDAMLESLKEYSIIRKEG